MSSPTRVSPSISRVSPSISRVSPSIFGVSPSISSRRMLPHLEGTLQELVSATFLGRTWEEKFARVRSSNLFICKNKAECDKGNHLVEIPLHEVDVYEAFIEGSAKSYVFKISNGEQKEYCFAVDSAEECGRWVSHLMRLKQHWANNKVSLTCFNTKAQTFIFIPIPTYTKRSVKKLR